MELKYLSRNKLLWCSSWGVFFCSFMSARVGFLDGKNSNSNTTTYQTMEFRQQVETVWAFCQRGSSPQSDHLPQVSATMMRSAFAILPCLGLGVLLASFWTQIQIPGSRPSGRELGDSDAPGATNPSQAIPNLFEGLRCPGRWREVLSTKQLLGILLGLAAYACLAASFWLAGSLFIPAHQLEHRWDCRCLAGLVPLVVAVPVGVLTSGPAASRLGVTLRLSLPHSWQQVTRCHLRWVARPRESLPAGCGADLSQQEQQQRRQYYVSMIFFLTFLAFTFGVLLTRLGRATLAGLERLEDGMQSRSSSRVFYQAVVTEEEEEQQPPPLPVMCYVIAFHVLCAVFSLWAVATGHLDMRYGLCWELWLAWATMMLASTALQGVYFTIFLPAEADSRIPEFGLAIVTPVVPVLGEPLDTFKDWLFVGLALSQRMFGKRAKT